MKLLNFPVFFLFLLICAKPIKLVAQKNGNKKQFRPNSVVNSKSVSKPWKLIFSDGFNTKGSFDSSKWSYSVRGNAAWAKCLTSTRHYATLNGSSLVLKMDNAALADENVPYHSGGIQTSPKFSFKYGKVEVRAKFKQGKGSWPAIWMMPEAPTAYGSWPKSGEIDIMEHVNNEDVIHQTIHNGKVTAADGGSSAAHSTEYNTTDFNTYGIIWSPEAVQFYVNDVLQYTYTKDNNATFQQWPFDKPFYLILNQSGGAGWPGAIKDVDLPFIMEVDWVRVYQKVKPKS